MSKLFKKDTKRFLNVLYKLSDKRFSFNIVHSYENGVNGYSLEMYFYDKYITSCSIPDFDITTAVYCLIDLLNYSELKNNQAYFDNYGISFKIYHCKNLNGKNYYSFKKHDQNKWVKISDQLASYILDQNDITIDGLCDNVVSYSQYDCYYDVNLKGGL